MPVATIVMLYPMETNKIVKHGDNIHVICHFHSDHFIFVHVFFFTLIPEIICVSPRSSLLPKDKYTGDNEILNENESRGVAPATANQYRHIHKVKVGEREWGVEKELNCQKELSSALAKNSFEHFWNAVGYQHRNYRVWQFERFSFSMYDRCWCSRWCCCCRSIFTVMRL